jgi:hypothetical protein
MRLHPAENERLEERVLIAEEGIELRDGNGAVVATIIHSCGQWVIGSDPQDQTVIIGMGTGEVRSHGTLHAGQELSSLSASLALPLTY